MKKNKQIDNFEIELSEDINKRLKVESDNEIRGYLHKQSRQLEDEA